MNIWIGFGYPDTTQLVELARRAEAIGFAGVALGDHLFVPDRLASAYPADPAGRLPWPDGLQFPDPWVSFAAMAAVTTRLRFLTCIYILPLRNPFVVAKAAGTAAVISNNRVVLGTGVGWMAEEFAQLGVDFHTRGRRVDEMIDVMRKLWRGGRAEHHGNFYNFDPLRMDPAPTQSVPIWVAGDSELSMRRAARMGDGWISMARPTVSGGHRDLHQQLVAADRVAQLREEAGRGSEPFEMFVSIDGVPAEVTLRELADRGIRNFRTTPWRWLPAGEDTTSVEAKWRALEQYAEVVFPRLPR